MLDFVVDKLPEGARPIGDGYYRVGRRTYVEADAVDYSTGEVKGRVYRDIRFEYLDPTPIAIPIYLKRAETTDQRIKRMMNEQRAWEKWCQRVDEGIEDMDDFEVPERPMFTSKYEDYLDLRKEAAKIAEKDVMSEAIKRSKRRRGDKAQMDIEDIPEVKKKSPKSSTENVDKSKIGHNKGPKIDEDEPFYE